MDKIHIITPVKDSIESTVVAIRAILSSAIDAEVTYTVYNDFSSEASTQQLEALRDELGFELVNLADITDHPSPNYLLILQIAQRRALEAGAHLAIVESDVTVRPETLNGLLQGVRTQSECGIAASVTVDDEGHINYPYLYARNFPTECCEVRRHCSFCCSLLTLDLLKKCDFGDLNPGKDWFDVHISKRSRELGFHNYLFVNLPVRHRPHSSRPWKQLKYTNPLKYYLLKFIKRHDKI